MLDTAVTNCTVKIGVFMKNIGGMTFKIRFNSIDKGGQSLNGMCGSFARNSPCKQNRYKKRGNFLESGPDYLISLLFLLCCIT